MAVSAVHLRAESRASEAARILLCRSAASASDAFSGSGLDASSNASTNGRTEAGVNEVHITGAAVPRKPSPLWAQYKVPSTAASAAPLALRWSVNGSAPLQPSAVV